MDIKKIYNLSDLLLTEYEKIGISLYMQKLSLGVYAGYPRTNEKRPDLFINALLELTASIEGSRILSYPFDAEDIKFLKKINGLDKTGLNFLAKIKQIVNEESYRNEAEIERFGVFKKDFDRFCKRLQDIRNCLRDVCSADCNHKDMALVKIYLPTGIIDSSPTSIYSEIRKYTNKFKLIMEALDLPIEESQVIEVKQGSIAITLGTIATVAGIVAITIERILKLYLTYLEIRLKQVELSEKEEKIDEKQGSPSSVMSRLSDLAKSHFSDDEEVQEVIASIKSKFKEKYDNELENEIIRMFNEYFEEKLGDKDGRKNEICNGFSQLVKHISCRIIQGATYTVEFPRTNKSQAIINNELLFNYSYSQLQKKGALMAQYKLIDSVLTQKLSGKIEHKRPRQ